MNRLMAHLAPLEGHELPREFWASVRYAGHRLLMMDYDGTLVPFQIDRSEAWLPSDLRGRLRRVAAVAGTYVVIISGRGVWELGRLLGPMGAHLVGEHGWEEQTPDGRVILRRLPGEAAKDLGRAARAARANGWGQHLERKRCSLVLHTRGLPPERAAELEERCVHLWGTLFQRDGLRLTRIDGGFELRALAHHEGTAVAGLIAASVSGTLPVYLGDDLSDEEAFYEVLGRGVAIRVGSGPRETVAHYHLIGHEDVIAFLDCWDDTTRPAAA